MARMVLAGAPQPEHPPPTHEIVGALEQVNGFLPQDVVGTHRHRGLHVLMLELLSASIIVKLALHALQQPLQSLLFHDGTFSFEAF